jgi:ATP-dependent helicase/nuclease subunit A
VNVTGLVDEAARRTIREALDTTLVVEAAAGTGKTSELVQRVAAVIRSGRGRVGSLVAVTFTEKAAGEMKLRLRTELDRALTEAGGEPEVHARLRAALSELETARIGTIHGLCGELLRAHPVEAGVDPAFRTADEELSQRLLRAEFEHWLDGLRKAPPPGVLRVLSRGRIDDGEDGREALWFALRALTDTRDFDALYRYPQGFDRTRELPRVARELYALGKLAAPVQSPKDPLRIALVEIHRRLHAVRGASLDELEAVLRALAKKRDLWDRNGRYERFGNELRADVLKRRDAARAELLVVMAKASAELAAHLCRELREVVARYEAQKAREGVLDFFDLLLRARQLLRDAPHVRRALADGTTHVFVDEFQDVDPVQGEILLYLASADAAQNDPYAAPLVPGKLCVVGDPKQSIYRFRRADIALYDRIKRHLVARGAAVATLSTSFRSVPALQSVVNAAFAPWMGGDASLGQAAYVPLSAYRAGRPGQPAVVALPAPRPFSAYGNPPKVTKKAVSGSLPDAVAAYIDWLVRESGYVVEEGGVDVPVAARHVCLLFKRFRSWEGDVTRPYVRALEARRVPHVLSGGRGLFEREEVRALMAALTAVEWPDDELAVYATLRGPFAGFTDDVLLRYRLIDGSLSPFRADPEAHSDAPELREVAEVLALVRRLHYARNAEAASGTIARLLAALRSHAGVAIWPTGEQALGNLLRIAELARAFEQRPEATSFRAFLAHLEARAAQGEMADATVVEESSDGVRLMTVHGSKGLEFPVVVLCDPAAPLRVEHPSRHIDAARGLWAQALCGAEPEELAEHRAEVTAHDEAELVRLTYVAATRAKEMLVVPSTAEGPLEGWLELLRPAVHPASEHARKTQASALRLPAFGPTSFVIHEHDEYADPERGVIPGVHRPALGDHELVIWDPCLLGPRDTPLAGVSQEELLKADGAEGRDEAGLAAYRAHAAERAARRERGQTPSYRVRSVTGEAASAELAAERLAEAASELSEPHEPSAADVVTELAALGVTLIDTGAARDLGLGGTRFGKLVHALFEYARPGGPSLDALSGSLARTLGASEHERAHAVERVARAQAHPFWKRVEAADARGEVMREAQLVARRAADELVEGVADLVCFEEEAGVRRVLLVDFKTDGRLLHAGRYARQLDAYAARLREALGVPVERALFWV